MPTRKGGMVIVEEYWSGKASLLLAVAKKPHQTLRFYGAEIDRTERWVIRAIHDMEMDGVVCQTTPEGRARQWALTAEGAAVERHLHQAMASLALAKSGARAKEEAAA